MSIHLRAAVGAFAIALWLAGTAGAQVPGLPQDRQPAADSAGLPDPLTPEAVHEMVARMSDDQVREMLLERLDAVAARAATPTEPPGGMLNEVVGVWTRLVADLGDALRRLPVLLSGQGKALANFAATYGSGGVATLFGMMAVALAAGLAVEALVRLLSRRWQIAEVAEDRRTLWTSLRFLFNRFLREMAGLVGFYVGVRTVGLTLLDDRQLLFAAPFVLYLIWMPRLGAAFSRFVLAPNRPDLRLVNIGDRWAGYLHRNLVGLVLLAGFAVFIVRFDTDNGVAMAEARIAFWLNTAVHVYIGIIAWRARAGLTDMMRGTDPDRTATDEWVANAYPWFAIGVSAAMWLVVMIVAGYGHAALLATAPHYTTMFWLLMAPALDTMIRGLVRHLQPPMLGDGPVAERAYRETRRSFIRIGRVLVAGIVLLIIANAWQIDLIAIRGEEGSGAVFFQFLITLAIGYTLFEGSALWFNRRLAREQTSRQQSQDEAAGEGGGSGGSRLATVLPLMRISAQTAIAVIFVLLALGNLGIDITPLLAGAGILGLAIGFGAQKLVSDVVSGVFFLIDDAFRVGEFVDVGGTTGAVEKISIRSMQLRHHRGAVHTVPYGEISKLTNYSRDWVIMKLMFTVPFDTDPDTIKKIFKKIGVELMADPELRDGFLEPFKSQGVFDFDDVGMVVRGKFMARPGTQFTIRKEIYNRVKTAFKAAGIEFARREVRVAMPGRDDDHRPTEAERTALAAAAAGAVHQQVADKS